MSENLLILAADHRSSLKTNILRIKKSPNKREINALKDFKKVILESLLISIKKGINKDYCVLLMDEDFGVNELINAKKHGIKIMVPVEKSGQNMFMFNYGSYFREHIEKFKPDYVKVLIHYNPDNKSENRISLRNLRILSNYVKTTKFKFLIEILIDPTKEQISTYGKRGFDLRVRPKITVKAIHQFNKAGIFPHIWKLEGFETKKDIDLVANAVGKARIVILGRSESINLVLKWIKTGVKNKKVVGFAVGRTLFMSPLDKYYHGKLTRDNTIKRISDNYIKIAKFYLGLKNNNRI